MATVRRRGTTALLAAAAGGTALACLVTVVNLHHGGTPYRVHLGGWGTPLGIDLMVDGLAALMLITTAVIALCITVYARTYFGAPSAGGRKVLFWPLWLIMWGALNALFLSADVFTLYVTLELINLSAVALVGLPRTADALRAAIRYLFIAFLGSLSYLFGVGLLYGSAGALDIATVAAAVEPTNTYYAAAALMLVGLMIKSALFPMHFWLPPAHANAPSPVSALLSGLVVTASVYILIRLGFTVFRPLLQSSLPHLLGGLGAAAVIWGSVTALLQARVKMVIAYSTLAQVGYVYLLFPLAAGEPEAAALAWYGGVYFAVCHACAKAAAFLAAGVVMKRVGHDDVMRLPGLARALPMAFFAFGVAGINLVGLPPSGGFMAKWLLLQAALVQGAWTVVAVLAAGSLLAAGYTVRVMERAFVEKGRNAAARAPDREGRTLALPALALALVPLALGFFAHIPLGLLEIGSPVGGLP
jgi:formate hydrogenlyase subunit 3/multisubunit Na+/H+ antiporter MnhD subunit